MPPLFSFDSYNEESSSRRENEMPKSKSASTPAPKKTSKRAITVAPKPSNEEIALRAYQIYLERGSTPGDPMQDWLQAERELTVLVPAKKVTRRKTKVVPIAA
jgi:hypothetical protein